MQDFINFIVDNWQFIGSAAISVISFILLLIFKRVKLVDNSIAYHMLKWIESAEAIFKQGEDKKQYVLGRAREYLGNDYKESDVTHLMEYILSLPEKKAK